MAESPQFETLVQSLSSTLQSLEQKRKELKKQGHSTGIWVGGIILVIGIAFSLYANAALIGPPVFSCRPGDLTEDKEYCPPGPGYNVSAFPPRSWNVRTAGIKAVRKQETP